MDKRIPNPLTQPPDIVLKSAVYLAGDVNFQTITTWIQGCYAYALNLNPAIKEEIDYRWNQGQCQALLMILNAFTKGREELIARQTEAEKNRMNRNP